MHIAKTIVIDTYLFFKNGMITVYKIHVYIKTLSLVQLHVMHVDLNMCFKINETKYKISL